MKTGVLISVLIYEFVLIGGMGLWLARRARTREAGADEFALGGRQLPLVVVAATLALTVLGSPHILGILSCPGTLVQLRCGSALRMSFCSPLFASELESGRVDCT